MSDPWVLLFAYHFPPENSVGGARPYRFYRYLPRFGYRCHVITAADVSVRPDLDAEYVPDPFELAAQSAGPHAPQKDFGWQVERAFRKFVLPGVAGSQWAFQAYRAAVRFLEAHPGERVTAVSTFPPLGTHLAAWLLARQNGIPWIADFRDPLDGNPLHDLLPARSRLIYRYVQRAIVDSAGASIANTDEAERLLKQKHPAQASRVHLIWNGFDPEQRISALPLPERPYKLLSHVGELYQGRTAAPLLESFDRLIHSGKVRAGTLRVEQAGHVESSCLPGPAFLRAAEAQGWLKLHWHRVPKLEALQIAQTSDGLLLIQPQSAIQVPGKLFEYLQIGRPILAFVPRRSSIEGVLEKSGITYRCVYTGSPPDLVDAVLLDFLSLPSTPLQPSKWFEETFNAVSQTGTLVELIGQL